MLHALIRLRCGWASSADSWIALGAASGLFVPKPTTDADSHGCGQLGLGTNVWQRSRAPSGGGADRYSVGYSVARGRCAGQVLNSLRAFGVAAEVELVDQDDDKLLG